MDVLRSVGQRNVAETTNEKTVHKSDIKAWAKHVENVHQGVSKLVKRFEDPGLSLYARGVLGTKFNDLLTRIEGAEVGTKLLRDKLESSSYHHHKSKGRELESLAAKMTDDLSKLEKVQQQYIADHDAMFKQNLGS